MEKATISGGALMVFIPELRMFLSVICVTLFVILSVQILLMWQRCKDRHKRLQRIADKGGHTCERSTSVGGDR